METSASIGAWGERIATDWLREQGFVILERNWRNGRYEIDIIARRWDEIHFVEVKTRKADGWTTPEQAIDEKKFHSLRRAAALYLSQHHSPEQPSFDLCAVLTHRDGTFEVSFTENAMESHW